MATPLENVAVTSPSTPRGIRLPCVPTPQAEAYSQTGRSSSSSLQEDTALLAQKVLLSEHKSLSGVVLETLNDADIEHLHSLHSEQMRRIELMRVKMSHLTASSQRSQRDTALLRGGLEHLVHHLVMLSWIPVSPYGLQLQSPWTFQAPQYMPVVPQVAPSTPRLPSTPSSKLPAVPEDDEEEAVAPASYSLVRSLEKKEGLMSPSSDGVAKPSSPMYAATSLNTQECSEELGDFPTPTTPLKSRISRTTPTRVVRTPSTAATSISAESPRLAPPLPPLQSHSLDGGVRDDEAITKFDIDRGHLGAAPDAWSKPGVGRLGVLSENGVPVPAEVREEFCKRLLQQLEVARDSLVGDRS